MDVYSVINGLGLYEVIKFVCRALKFNFRDIAINLTAVHVYSTLLKVQSTVGVLKIFLKKGKYSREPNLRENKRLYWGRTRVTTLHNSVKPKRIPSISMSVRKKHTIRRGFHAITFCNQLRPEKKALLKSFSWRAFTNLIVLLVLKF